MWRHEYSGYITLEVKRLSYRDFLRETRLIIPDGIYTFRLRHTRVIQYDLIRARISNSSIFYKTDVLNYVEGINPELDTYLSEKNITATRISEIRRQFEDDAI